MWVILVYSVLLGVGMAASQVVNLSAATPGISLVTNITLSLIIMEVGLEFHIDKAKIKSYGWDFATAFFAAAIPWVLCALYFCFFLSTPPKQAFLVGIFAAPTSAGILFAMLAAAGLGRTWVFRKAQMLAIFDDFDSILLLIVLQIIALGFRWHLLINIGIALALLAAGYTWLGRLRWPVTKGWLIFYSVCVCGLNALALRHHIEMGVILPAFVMGALLRHSPSEKSFPFFDCLVRAVFMLGVGLSLPKIVWGPGLSLAVIIGHILALTVLSNAGKCVLFGCYKPHAWRDRLALSIAMFPRGEVGAGVLLIALGYGLNGNVIGLAIGSLALNLILTGVFIWAVLKLKPSDHPAV